MNQPLGSCLDHFQEIVNLTDELERHKTSLRQPVPDDSRESESEDEGSGDGTPGTLEMARMDVDDVPIEPDNPEVDDGLTGDGHFVENYPGAAKVHTTSGMTFMKQFDVDEFAEERTQNLYYPFASRAEWELAAFLLRSDLSIAALDTFLSLSLVSHSPHRLKAYTHIQKVQGLQLSFRTGKRLRELAEMLPKAPEWKCKPLDTVYPTKKPVHLYYRDPLECIKSILYSPLIKDFIHYTPFRLYDSAAKATRLYTEWLSGNVAWSMQVSLFQYQNYCF